MDASPVVDGDDEASWRTLRVAIEQTIALEESQIELGDRSFTWFRVADPDQLLTAAISNPRSQPEEELDPFWAATWRAAQGLDRFLATIDLQEQRVLELGCGSGQAGVGAAARGALVTMTDVVEIALRVARLNSRPLESRISFRRLNWKDRLLDERPFPIIIGSDLVYDVQLFPLLERCARAHLAEGGKLYLSEPHRHTGDFFSQWIREVGWQTQEHDVDLNDARIPIRIFECCLSV